jgi:hypothetical protein
MPLGTRSPERLRPRSFVYEVKATGQSDGSKGTEASSVSGSFFGVASLLLLYMIDWFFISIVLLLLFTLSLLALGQVAVFMRFVSGL